MERSNVDFPAPDAPSKTENSPGAKHKSTGLSAHMPLGYVTPTPRSANTPLPEGATNSVAINWVIFTPTRLHLVQYEGLACHKHDVFSRKNSGNH
jgi:hypothetical protein